MLVHGFTDPKVVSYIYGIGGRDVRMEDIETVYNDLEVIANNGDVIDSYRYLGLKGGRD